MNNFKIYIDGKDISDTFLFDDKGFWYSKEYKITIRNEEEPLEFLNLNTLKKSSLVNGMDSINFCKEITENEVYKLKFTDRKDYNRVLTDEELIELTKLK